MNRGPLAHSQHRAAKVTERPMPDIHRSLTVAARVVGQAFSLRGAFSPAERAGETG
jgi:hypothetical protein